jgi:single-strand DNA-binding protein
MNNWCGVGRLVADPDVKYTNDGKTIAKFKVAIDRRFKKDETDFIPCTAFGKTAEIVEKYFRKGMRIGVNGSIQTGSYTNKENQKVYTTEIAVDNIEFVESKQQEEQKPQENKKAADDGFMNIPDGADEQLPFN